VIKAVFALGYSMRDSAEPDGISSAALASGARHGLGGSPHREVHQDRHVGPGYSR